MCCSFAHNLLCGQIKLEFISAINPTAIDNSFVYASIYIYIYILVRFTVHNSKYKIHKSFPLIIYDTHTQKKQQQQQQEIGITGYYTPLSPRLLYSVSDFQCAHITESKFPFALLN